MGWWVDQIYFESDFAKRTWYLVLVDNTIMLVYILCNVKLLHSSPMDNFVGGRGRLSEM